MVQMRSNWKPLNLCLNGVLEENTKGKAEIELSYQLISLVRSWRILVGEKLFQQTFPIGPRGDKFYILTSHSAYSEQLNMMSPYLLEKIKKKVPRALGKKGKVVRLVFKSDPNFFQSGDHQRLLTDSIGERKRDHYEDKLPHPNSPEFRQIKREAKNTFEGLDLQEQVKESLIKIYLQDKFWKKNFQSTKGKSESELN